MSYEAWLSEDQPGMLRFGGARMALFDIEAGFWGLRRQLEALAGPRLTDTFLQQAGANGGASFAWSIVGADTASNSERALRECIAAYQAAGFGQFEIHEIEWPIGRISIQGHDTFEAWMAQQHQQNPASGVCAYTAGVLVGFVNALTGRQDIVCVERACQAQGATHCLFELLPSALAGDMPVVAMDPDPALGRHLNLVEILFDRMPMGIAVLDRDYLIRRYNPTWNDYSRRYAPPSAMPLALGVNYFDHLPGSESLVVPLFEQVLDGETVYRDGLRLESDGSVSYWDVVLAPLVEDGQVNGILIVSIDATERVMAQQNLEQRVEERTRELTTILQLSQAISSTLDLEPLLNLILDQLKVVVDYTGATVLILEEGDLIVRAYRGPIPREEALHLRFSQDESSVNRQVIQQQAPLVIADVRGDEPLAGDFRQTAGDQLESTFGYIRSWLGVPLMARGEMLGMLTLDHNQPGFFSTRHANLVLTFASQVAVALENARLYAQAEKSAVAAERNRLARDLHDAVTQTLFSSSIIAEVLPRIWERDVEEGRRRLQELRELSRGALAEMRTLLLELRPTALIETRLVDLLRQLAESITGRARVPVTLNVDDECKLDPAVKVALYRIAQEALNNVVKHAGASKASVSLRCLDSAFDGRTEIMVALTISDDGTGFDPLGNASNSLGLGIMRERAESIGAILTIDSQPGAGTQVEVVWRSTGQ